MKKIYLVKKDVNKPAGEGNWSEMNQHEFSLFMKTTEGRGRRKYLAQLDAIDQDDYIIIAECDEKVAMEIRAEKKRRDYKIKVKKETGYIVFSYNEQKESEDNLTAEELLEDKHIDVSNTAINNCMIKRMREGMKVLSEKERHLIYKVYLSDDPITVHQYAKKYEISTSTTYARLGAALGKLRKFFNN